MSAHSAIRASQPGGPFRVVVGVSAGIAAYKACILVRTLLKAGVDVDVVPTPAALEMVGRATWEALTGKEIYTQVGEDAAHVGHVRRGHEADLIVVAPTTANTLAKLRAGMADNLLTSTILAARCPVMLVPAMHTEMWLNPATVENVAVLRTRGIEVLEVANGRLTGSDSGPGRMLEPEDIAVRVLERLEAGNTADTADTAHATTRDLEGLQVVISAGGTREAIDPVRFLGNRSTGAFGIHVAQVARERGATVRLVAANIDDTLLATAQGVDIERVVSAGELSQAMHAHAQCADVLVMAAAVADFRPATVSESKRKKDTRSWSLELVENPDILASLASHRGREGQIVVGFAAETGDKNASVSEYGREKAARKGADLMVVNEVGATKGFGEVDTAISIIDATGRVHAQGRGSKAELAHLIVDAVATYRRQGNMGK